MIYQPAVANVVLCGPGTLDQPFVYTIVSCFRACWVSKIQSGSSFYMSIYMVKHGFLFNLLQSSSLARLVCLEELKQYLELLWNSECLDFSRTEVKLEVLRILGELIK